MSIDYKNPKIKKIDDILNMEFYTKVYKKKFFWWDVSAIFYEASVVSGCFSVWKLSILAALLTSILIFFWLLFMVICVVKYCKIWRLAYPILNSYDNSVGDIPFSEYGMRGKIERIFNICALCVLIGCLLFLFSLVIGWVQNSVTGQVCMVIALIPPVLMLPLMGIKGKVVSSCDFLTHIHRREKIKNAKKESKNHRNVL